MSTPPTRGNSSARANGNRTSATPWIHPMQLQHDKISKISRNTIGGSVRESRPRCAPSPPTTLSHGHPTSSVPFPFSLEEIPMIKKIGLITAALAAGAFHTDRIASADTPVDDSGQVGLVNLNIAGRRRGGGGAPGGGGGGGGGRGGQV